MKANKGNRTASAVGRGGAGGGGGAGADAGRLRQQLVHARAQISDLEEELQEKNNLYLAAIKDRDAGAAQLSNAKESLQRFDALVKEQVQRAMGQERADMEEVKRARGDLEREKTALKSELEQ